MAHRPHPVWRATMLVVALLLTFSGGAVAKAKYDARNADKVDGRHAVASSTPPAKRKGKLVATSPKTGRLPDNIIGTAPRARVARNAQALGGVPAAALKTLTFPVTSAGESDGANDGSSIFVDEVNLNQADTGSLAWTFLLPADRVAGDEIFADVLYQDGSAGACSWFASTGGVIETEDATFANSAWFIPGGAGYSGAVDVPAGAPSAHRATFRLATSDRVAGDLVSFMLTRQPDDPTDNCTFGIRIRAIQFRY